MYPARMQRVCVCMSGSEWKTLLASETYINQSENLDWHNRCNDYLHAFHCIAFGSGQFQLSVCVCVCFLFMYWKKRMTSQRRPSTGTLKEQFAYWTQNSLGLNIFLLHLQPWIQIIRSTWKLFQLRHVTHWTITFNWTQHFHLKTHIFIRHLASVIDRSQTSRSSFLTLIPFLLLCMCNSLRIEVPALFPQVVTFLAYFSRLLYYSITRQWVIYEPYYLLVRWPMRALHNRHHF